MNRRVVITGIGFVSPVGSQLESFWSALIEGRSGLRVIDRFDPSPFNCQLGGQVDDAELQALDPRYLRTVTHASQLGLLAVERALQDAQLPPASWENPGAVALLVGCALGGLRSGEQQYAVIMERGVRRVNPFLANGSLPFATAAELAAVARAQGPQLTITTGCTASTQAIALGQQLIAAGEAEVVIAGGTESPLTVFVLASMGRTMELARDSSDPQRASRPFDRRHNGMVLSEGACMLVLEPRERALARGAHVYAEVLGGTSSCDARGLFPTDPSGEVGAAAICALLRRCRLGPGNVQWLCAHANASPTFDSKETRVAKAAFGEWAAKLPVSSIKAVLGHPFGASGAFQTVAACLALRHQLIPPTHFLEQPADDCDLDYVPNVARPAQLEHVLVSSYGYGGANAYLLVRHPEA
ncbi:MAG: beta-ketoacyl-[acyl-carrier-protein] synthase family protein [Candidatus Binatia bacterium]|nr:beta-ketoacyl-[acyl-carrier-protein] synthase family protein [Candidatus Binatia bacterium]